MLSSPFEIIPWPEVRALSQYIAPLTRTRPQTPYDSLSLWLAVVPKRRSVISLQHSQYMAAPGHHHTSIQGLHHMTSGLRRSNIWALKICSSILGTHDSRAKQVRWQ